MWDLDNQRRLNDEAARRELERLGLPDPEQRIPYAEDAVFLTPEEWAELGFEVERGKLYLPENWEDDDFPF